MAAETVVRWCKRSMEDGALAHRDRSEESLKYCKLIFGHLMDLVHGSLA